MSAKFLGFMHEGKLPDGRTVLRGTLGSERVARRRLHLAHTSLTKKRKSTRLLRQSCSACGSREIETKPELYRGSIEAMRRGHCHVQFATPIRPPSIVNPALRMGYLRRDASSRSMLLPISSTPTVRLPDHGPGWTRQ
jgi:hypothetical protein